MKVRQYLEENHKRIWAAAKPKHRKASYARCLAFCHFLQNGDRDISTIRANDVFVFLDHLITTRKSSPATANRYKAAIATLMTHAVEDEYRTRGIRVKNYKEPEGRRYVFSQEEVAKIIKFFRASRAPYIADMCILSYHTGMRLGEVLQIGYSAEVETDEDGDTFVKLTDTKNGDDRVVYLSADATKAALSLKGLYSIFSETTFYTLWGELRASLGVRDSEFCFHAFRHTAATFMANELAMSGSIVGKILGHRSPKTTERYIKTLVSSKKAAAAGMPKVA